MKNIRILILTAMCSFFLTGAVSAHRVNVFAWIEGDTVFVESKFSGGKKVKDGEITVTDSRGTELLSGKTNHQGEFSFKLPQRTELKIILEAGMGHRAEWTIPAADIASIAPAEDTPTGMVTVKQVPANAEAKQQDRHPSIPTPTSVGPSLAEIEAVVEKSLDKKLKPVLKMLAESRLKGPTVKDILGGIGYIIGLVGIAAYFRYRKGNAGGQ